MKILRLVWEIVFPFEIEWRTPKQQARCRQPIKVKTTQSLNVAEVLESPSESQAANASGKRVAA